MNSVSESSRPLGTTPLEHTPQSSPSTDVSHSMESYSSGARNEAKELTISTRFKAGASRIYGAFKENMKQKFGSLKEKVSELRSVDFKLWGECMLAGLGLKDDYIYPDEHQQSGQTQASRVPPTGPDVVSSNDQGQTPPDPHFSAPNTSNPHFARAQQLLHGGTKYEAPEAPHGSKLPTSSQTPQEVPSSLMGAIFWE